jgi:hypothetical protein
MLWGKVDNMDAYCEISKGPLVDLLGRFAVGIFSKGRENQRLENRSGFRMDKGSGVMSLSKRRGDDESPQGVSLMS